MNSACGSTNFLMSHGQATRSTFTFSRVIHFMAALLRLVDANFGGVAIALRDGEIEPVQF